MLLSAADAWDVMTRKGTWGPPERGELGVSCGASEEFIVITQCPSQRRPQEKARQTGS